MARGVSSLFRTVVGGDRSAQRRPMSGEDSYDLIEPAITFSEGDVSVDLMRRFCESEDLGLRDHLREESWYDLVGEVNTGIQLYYLAAEGRLWQVIRQRRRRQEAISSIVSRLPGPLFGQRSLGARQPLSPSIGVDRAVTEIPEGIRREDPAAPDLRSQQVLHPVRVFLGEARTQALPPEAMFARFVGRVFLMWLDCGPTDRPFPRVPEGSQASPPHSIGAIRVTGSVAIAADIGLTPLEIYDAWTLSIDVGADRSVDVIET